MKAFHRVIASCVICGLFSVTLTACGGGGSSDPLVTELQAAQRAYDSALRAETKAEETLNAAIRTQNEDAAALAEAQALQPTLEANINTAISDRQTGEALYQQRQSETVSAKTALTQIQEDQKEPRLYKNNSLGFFIWNSSDSGSDIEMIKKYFLGQVTGSHEAVPDLSRSTDATSYQNFKNSIQWLDKGNEMRHRENTSEGTNLKDLAVTDFAMAVSELHADYSKGIIDHHANSGQCDFHFGENLAWGDRKGQDGPFEAWYTKEKQTYQKDPTNRNNDPKWYNSVGHYLNIVNPDYKASGFAINNDPDCLYDKLYAYGLELTTHGEKAYTVEQYRARISAYEAYLRQLDVELNQAKNAVSSAETAENNAFSALNRLDQNITNAEKAKDENDTKISTLSQKASQNQKDVESAQAELEQRKAEVSQAKQTLEDAKQALKDAQNTEHQAA